MGTKGTKCFQGGYDRLRTLESDPEHSNQNNYKSVSASVFVSASPNKDHTLELALDSSAVK